MSQPTKNADSNLEREIGLRIMQLRGIESQAQLAEAVGVSREIIQHWERGSRHIKAAHLIALSKHFNVTTDYLLGLSPTETNDRDIAAIGDYTGLTAKCIDTLLKLNYADAFPFIIHLLSDYDGLGTAFREIGRAYMSSFIAATAKKPLREDEAQAYNDFRNAVYLGEAMYEDEALNKRALAGEIVLSPTEAVDWYKSRAKRVIDAITESALSRTIQELTDIALKEEAAIPIEERPFPEMTAQLYEGTDKRGTE